ncbi:MAG TPA: EAL domain-containing protein [Trichocoleus sp.]
MHCAFSNIKPWQLLPGLAASALTTALLVAGSLQPLSQLESRMLFRLRGQQAWDSRVVVIAIDDASLRQYGRFPWPRQHYADLLEQLRPSHPSAVVVSLLLTEPTPDDDALAQQMAQQGAVILAQSWDTHGEMLAPVPVLQQSALGTGHVYFQRDRDGLVRRLTPILGDQPALSLAAAQAYGLTTAAVPLLPPDHLWINWPGSVQQLQQYSFKAVMQGQVPPQAFQNKIVLLGVTATAIDPLTTPFDEIAPASSVHLHAAALDNILQQRFLQPLGGALPWSGLILLAVGLGAVLTRQQGRRQLLVIAVAVGSWAGLALLLFTAAYWLPVTPPVLLLVTTGLMAYLQQQLQETLDLKHLVKTLWQTYQKDLIIHSGPGSPAVAPLDSVNQALPIAQLATLAEQFGRSQSTQAAIARSLPIGLVAADRQSQVWFCNPVAAQWLGLKPGDYLADHLVPNWTSAEAWQKHWQQGLRGQSERWRTAAGIDQWFELRLEPVVAAGAVEPESLVLMLEDITARTQAEQVLQSLNHTLEKQVKQRTDELLQVNQALQQEVEDRRQAQEQLAYEAFHDSLTGLPSRNQFLIFLEQCLTQLHHEPHTPFAVLFLDCDRFKLINDSFGHWMGDELLKALSQRLRNCIRPNDVLARFGGDEFTILLRNLADLQEAVWVAKRIRQRLGKPFRIGQEQIFTNASIGIVVGTSTYQTSQEILRDADTAMYRAKTGGLEYALFEPDMHIQVQNSLRLEMELRLALERQELRLHYQPIVSLDGLTLLGFEALLRWQHSSRGLLPPDVFIPLAEETGLIVPIGEWVLREACQHLYQWQQQRLVPPHTMMSVNLSVAQFMQPDLLQQIDQVLADTQLAGQYLKLEITESAIMANAELAETVFQALQERQIKLSIDDFGTGYSSLSYLHRFPVDTLKIDRSFIQQIDCDRKQFGIASAIIKLARHLEMSVIAEGIERPIQVNFLKTLGCQFGQGYLFSRPLAKADLLRFLHNHNFRPS